MLERSWTLRPVIKHRETFGSTACGCMVGASLPTLHSAPSEAPDETSSTGQADICAPVFLVVTSRAAIVPRGRDVGTVWLMASMLLTAVRRKQLGHPSEPQLEQASRVEDRIGGSASIK